MESSCKLILSLDTGASLTKGIVTVSTPEETTTGIIEMESNVFEIDSSILKNQDYLIRTDPENRAWITKGLKKNMTAIAVGTLAKKYDNLKDGLIEGVKYEHAVEKILAAIGVAIERYSLNREKFECHINLLIPSDETEGKDLIENDLKKIIKKFQFGGENIRGKLEQLNCFPEGSGGLLFRKEQESNSGNSVWIKQSKIAILMLGHRNCSFLTIEKGVCQKRETVRIGYFDILSDIKKTSIGQKMCELEEVIPLICQGNQDNNSDRYFRALVRGDRQSNQKKEIEKLKRSYEEAHQIYWRKLQPWIEAHMPTYVDEILILGGVAQKFKTELSEYLHWTNLFWGDSAVDEIESLFPKFAKNENLAYRFIDVYGVHKNSCRF